MVFRQKLFRRNFFRKEKTDNICEGNYISDKKKRDKSKFENNQVVSQNSCPHLKSVSDGGLSQPKTVSGCNEKNNALLAAKIKCNDWNHESLAQATLALILQSNNLPAGSPKATKRLQTSNANTFSDNSSRINLNHPAFKSSVYTRDYVSRANQFKRFEKYMNKRSRRTGAPLHSILEVEEDDTDL